MRMFIGHLRRRLPLAAILAFTFLVVACGPSWRVIRSSGTPSALRGVSAATVAFDYSAVLLGGTPEAQWLADKDDARRADYQGVKEGMDATFMSRIVSNLPDVQLARVDAARPPAADEYRLTVRYQLIEMGKYAVMFAMPSRLGVQFVWTRGEEPLDAIEVTKQVDATVTQPSIVQRMNIAAARAAADCAQYFNDSQKRTQ